jgi:hypothetical protein
MKDRLDRFGIMFITTMAGILIACGGDTQGSSSSSSSGGDGAGGTGGTGGSGSSSSSTGAGGAAALPNTGTEIMSAGGVVQSGKYQMVYNFGASTPAPGKASSANHTLQGGLVGVTEGTK